jgi:hypothetical protein
MPEDYRVRAGADGAETVGVAIVVAWAEPGDVPGNTTTRVPTWTWL